jgi:hypothetical protein
MVGKRCGWLWISLCLQLCFCSSKNVAASFHLGPIRLRPGRHSFVWQASVDTTGIATSKEQMLASPTSSLVKHFQRGTDLKMEERDVWSEVVDRLEKYPEWLVRGAVTFGLFHIVRVEERGYSLQDRFFGVNFLTFGWAESQRFSMLKPVPNPDIGEEDKKRVGDCTVVLPIRGGLLALCKPSRNGDMGCLKFTLRHNEALKETELVTEIQGYNPFLVGPKEPPPLYRRFMYLSVQSMVHAYVMWRFHRHCLYSSYNQS